jgi:hypothetical protein
MDKTSDFHDDQYTRGDDLMKTLVTASAIVFLLFSAIGESAAATRGRVQVVNGTVVADNGMLLRGEHLLMTTWNDARIQDLNWWLMMAEQYNLNTIRLLCYRNPMNIPGYTCNTSTQCMPVQDILPMLDIAVHRASQVGMYAIIDYHPVNGKNSQEAHDWWSVVAPRYKDSTHVIYEACNEPGTPSDPAFQTSIFHHIRSFAPNTHIIMWSFEVFDHTVNGFNMVNQLPLASTIDYSNASVGFHSYGPMNHDLLAQIRTAGYPAIMTEREWHVSNWSPQQIAAAFQGEVASWESRTVSWLLLSCYPRAAGLHPDYFALMNINWPRDPRTGLNPSSVDGTPDLPTEFALDQNYPNPFNPGTSISYSLPSREFVSVKVFNALGQEMISLVEGHRDAGRHGVKLDASRWPSGLYFYKVVAGSFVSTRKMILLK